MAAKYFFRSVQQKIKNDLSEFSAVSSSSRRELKKAKANLRSLCYSLIVVQIFAGYQARLTLKIKTRTTYNHNTK